MVHDDLYVIVYRACHSFKSYWRPGGMDGREATEDGTITEIYSIACHKISAHLQLDCCSSHSVLPWQGKHLMIHSITDPSQVHLFLLIVIMSYFHLFMFYPQPQLSLFWVITETVASYWSSWRCIRCFVWERQRPPYALLSLWGLCDSLGCWALLQKSKRG